MVALLFKGFLLPGVEGKRINVTIDDTYGDPLTNFVPIYNGNWTNDRNPKCETLYSSEACFALPTPLQNATNGTFHLSVSQTVDEVKPSVEIDFLGE